MLTVPNLGAEKEIAAIYFAKIIIPQLTKKIMPENSFLFLLSVRKNLCRTCYVFINLCPINLPKNTLLTPILSAFIGSFW